MNTKGFTLIDILISVAIISFLSSIVLFNTTEARKQAEDTHMQTEAGQVALAVEMYKLSNNEGQGPLRVNSSIPRGVMYREKSPEYIAAMEELVRSGYIASIPRSPDGESYAYGESMDGRSTFFVANTRRSGVICTSTGSGSCTNILPNEEEDNPYTVFVPDNNSPYNIFVPNNNIKYSITLEPYRTYLFTYAGEGSEMNFMVNGRMVLETFIFLNLLNSDELNITAKLDWTCSSFSCAGPNGDNFQLTTGGRNLRYLQITYFPNNNQ